MALDTGRPKEGDAPRRPADGDGDGERLYSVGEVVALSGISRQMVHNYTVLGLIEPVARTSSRRRYYDGAALRRIRLIRRMLDSGYTLQALRELFPWQE